ncbi:tripartite tricarboxylate transporter permease [Candidatus Pacearchaeota archaeon]|nr:tripartite tricarboxylate transporter permease [Candidatus Pacearchaeota archaeon]
MAILGLLVALLLGVTCGTLTGIIPGLHINLVSSIAVSSLTFLLGIFPPISIAVFIVSLSITNIFIEFIPSTFLGCPDESSSLSVLPAHQFLLEGKGHEAVVYSIYGCLIALPIIAIFTIVFIYSLNSIFSYLKPIMFLILISSSAYSILREDKKIIAFFIFTLSGFLGLSSLNLEIKDSLLPLLTGLFGSSSLITSIIKKQTIPEQKICKIKDIKITREELKNVFLASILSTPLCSVLPALGSSQAAIIGSDILEKIKQKEFIVLLGAINTTVMALSFVTLYILGKSRTGSAVAINTLLPVISFQNLLIILTAVSLTCIISSFLSLKISKIFSKNINKISYRKLSLSILFFLSFMIFIFSGILGFLLFIASTATGLVAIFLNSRRTNLMGSLMLPSILFYIPM